MRNYIVILILFFVTSSSAQVDLTGMKFCIDPGHGNYPHDKPYETRINLRVANFLKAYFEDYGAWVITTRQDSITDISLYDRDMIANNNNVDFFLSIHHNAFQGNANYSLMLYEEKSNGQPEWQGESDVMCNIMVKYLHKYMYTTGEYVRGDLSFLGFNLGVLKDLHMPGVLSEASFWDYVPEVHRLNSLGYLTLEAFALVHSFLDYYSVPKKTNAFVEGVVQDLDGNKLPGITVRLTNGADDMVYVTDSQDIGITDQDRSWGGFPQIYDVRNGMYFFDNFPQGQAKLIFEAQGYVSDTLNITVAARTSTRVSPFDLVVDVPPTIATASPADGDSSFSVFDNISIEFTHPMDGTTVENSFLLIPDVKGTFSWKDKNRQLTFSPGTRFEFDQNYVLQISAEAMNKYGFYLDGNGDGVAGDAFSLTFHTMPMDTSKPMVINFYPVKNDTGIFVNDILRAEFNKRLDPASVSGPRILLMSENHRRLSVLADYSEWNNFGLISILPIEPMKHDMKYLLTIANVITDLQGNSMDNHFQWTFRTQEQELKLSLIEDFETEAPSELTPLRWNLISQSEADSLKLSADRFAHGNQSMLLVYNFITGSESLAVLVDHASDSTWLKPGGTVAINVFGDNSGNQIRFIFEDKQGLEASHPIIIDWSGWINMRFDLANDPVIPWSATNPGNGTLDSAIYIAGFSVKANSVSTGKIYLDDVEQLFVPSPTSIQPGNFARNQPAQFKLYPNYPNPFNHYTTIGYDLPVRYVNYVQIKIYDMTGKEIRSLANKVQNAGHHEILWDGKDQRGNEVASGIYFCQLRVRDLVLTNKMLLIR